MWYMRYINTHSSFIIQTEAVTPWTGLSRSASVMSAADWISCLSSQYCPTACFMGQIIRSRMSFPCCGSEKLYSGSLADVVNGCYKEVVMVTTSRPRPILWRSCWVVRFTFLGSKGGFLKWTQQQISLAYKYQTCGYNVQPLALLFVWEQHCWHASSNLSCQTIQTVSKLLALKLRRPVHCF